ncbi:MAG: hypothetical protein U0935_14365 [Pirellulales bacterium]
MDHLDYLERLRRYVRATFEEMGADPQVIQETLLLRGGHYCGRRFRAGGHLAVWFCDENEVKFYAPQGGVSRVLRPAALTDADEKRAA